MATQVIGEQTKAAGQEHNPGRFANFVETVKELMGMYFNTHGSAAIMDPSHRSKLSEREKAEIDAYLNGVGPA